VIEAMKAARAAGVVTSLDLNYREKLWKPQGGMKRAHEVLGQIVENVDVLIGNEEDLQKGLGFHGPEVAASAQAASSKLDTSVFLGMMEQVVQRFPKTKVVATTLREVHNTNHHTWSAVAWVNGTAVNAPTAELRVLDRVGGGDGFASGFIYGLLSGKTPDESVRLGWAHGALMTTFPGDTTMATLDQVEQFAQGGSARIQR
jgi:2-dehydro-3-deoxygluconokinase